MVASRLSDSMYCLSFLPTLSCLFARYCCSSVAGMVGPGPRLPGRASSLTHSGMVVACSVSVVCPVGIFCFVFGSSS